MPTLAAARTTLKARQRRTPVAHRGHDDGDVQLGGLQGQVIFLQRAAGNGAVAGLVDSATKSIGELMSTASALLDRAIAEGAKARENDLTNQLFWAERPELHGQRLKPMSREAMRWLVLRDKVVRPMLRAPKKANQEDKKGVPSGLEPIAEAQAGGAETHANAGSAGTESTDRTGDKYFEQSGGRYRHTDAKGTVQVWKYKVSGNNICNMTTLTMSLVSMAGESEVRSRIIALLQTKGYHVGAAVEVGGDWVPLGDALSNPKIVDRIALIDLVTAAAIGETGGYGVVTKAPTMAALARATGIAKNTKALSGDIYLSTAKGRKRAEDLLAAGKRVIAGTVNHYVYLLEVQADGALVHDPAGARINPGKTDKPKFLHTGALPKIVREYSALTGAARERAQRRVSQNARLVPVLEKVDEIVQLAGKERVAALKAAQKDFPGSYELGVKNFYASSEYKENDFRLRLSVSN